MVWLYVVIGVIVLVVVALVLLYNRLVRLRNRTENAWAQVDVQLRRRYDLVPNLVEAVKGYAAHERETFEAVTVARSAAQAASGVEQQARAENVLTAALGRLIAIGEAYPELRASENFLDLQARLADIEESIAVSRQVYNDTVLTYMNAIQTVPANMVAGIFGFERHDRTSRSTTRPASPCRCSSEAAPRALPPQRAARRPVLLAAAPPALGQVLHAPAGRRPGPRSSRTARSGSSKRSLSTSSATSRAAFARSRCATASRSRTCSVTEAGVGVSAREPRRSSGAPGAPGTFGTDAHRRGGADRLALPGARRAPHVLGRLPPARAWPSPTTTWSTSTSRCGAPSGRSGSPADRPRRPSPAGRPGRSTASSATRSGCAATSGALPRRALLRAQDVPPRQFVELRVVFPALAPHLDGRCTGRSRERSGRGSSPRSGPTRRRTTRDRDRIRDALDHIGRTILSCSRSPSGPRCC